MAHIEIISDKDNGKCIIYLPRSNEIHLKNYTIDYFKINKNTRIFEWNYNNNCKVPYFFTTFYKMESINKIFINITTFDIYLVFTLIILEAIKDVQNEIYSHYVLLNNDLIFILEDDYKKVNKYLNSSEYNKQNISETIDQIKKQIKFINLDFSYNTQSLLAENKLNLNVRFDFHSLDLDYLNENTLSEFCLKLAEDGVKLLKKSSLWTTELENSYLKQAYKGLDSYLNICYKLLDYFSQYKEKNSVKNLFDFKLTFIDKIKNKNTKSHKKIKVIPDSIDSKVNLRREFIDRQSSKHTNTVKIKRIYNNEGV